MKKVLMLATAVAVGLSANAVMAATTVVSSFAGNDSTPGVWGANDIEPGGSASIGIAPAGDPNSFGPGAATLTTNDTNGAKTVVGVSNSFGTVSSIINDINLAYSYYKQADVSPDADPSAAPSLKLTFANNSTGQSATLIYEPYWNNGVGTVATDTWLTTGTINATTGLFWTNGGFGQPSGAGGPPLETLSQWVTSFNSTSSNAFSDAELTEVQMGLGSYNPGQTGYFDDVVIGGTNADATYNFEPAAVPLPSAAGMGLGMLGLIGAAGLLRKKLRTA